MTTEWQEPVDPPEPPPMAAYPNTMPARERDWHGRYEPVKPTKRRNRTLACYVSEYERQLIKRASWLCDLSMSEYTRRRIRAAALEDIEREMERRDKLGLPDLTPLPPPPTDW